jgi:peptidoglycan/xylan/chitin deacetylase (PgdA/CDA1 family)
LHLLTQDHVKATFMLGGAWATAHPDLVRALQQAGMELGNHGYGHRHVSLLSYEANLNEIERTNTAVAMITGQLPTVFAPPYGEFNATVLRAAAAAHMPLVMWTIDTIDWRLSSTPSVIAGRVLSRARAGAIVLMHPTERTVEALPEIVHTLTARGYRLVTVSTLLKMGQPTGDG